MNRSQRASERTRTTARVRSSASESFAVCPYGSASPTSLPQPVVDLDMGCGQEGVEVRRHKRIFNTLLPRLGRARR